LIFLPLLALLALEYPARQDHYLFALGWLAWPVAWNIQALALRLMDERDDFLAPAWHFADQNTRLRDLGRGGCLGRARCFGAADLALS
jgi:hypothetical protein